MTTPPPVLPRIQTKDQNLQLIQDNVSKSLTQNFGKTNSNVATLQAGPLNAGKILSANVIVAGGDNLIAHGLGHTPTEVLVFAPSAQSTVWLQASDATNINLHCSANCTVSAWVV